MLETLILYSYERPFVNAFVNESNIHFRFVLLMKCYKLYPFTWMETVISHKSSVHSKKSCLKTSFSVLLVWKLKLWMNVQINVLLHVACRWRINTKVKYYHFVANFPVSSVDSEMLNLFQRILFTLLKRIYKYRYMMESKFFQCCNTSVNN